MILILMKTTTARATALANTVNMIVMKYKTFTVWPGASLDQNPRPRAKHLTLRTYKIRDSQFAFGSHNTLIFEEHILITSPLA